MQRSLLISPETTEALLTGALAAVREGTLGDFLRQRRRATQWFARRHLQPVLGTAGDCLKPEQATLHATTMLLRWGASRLRPDLAAFDAPIEDVAWIERTSWRPFLALSCHFALREVPRFDARYRRSAEESPAENLCGLWNVGPSTFYRYLDKARRILSDALHQPLAAGEERLALREAVHGEICRLRFAASAAHERRTWHLAQAARAGTTRDACTALWHALQAPDAALFAQTLQRFRIELADKGETDALLARLGGHALSVRERFDLHLAEAALWRTRNGADREYRAYELALRQATEAGDKLLLGIVYGSLGWYHESRDVDRALACFEESADFLRQAELDAPRGAADEAAGEYVGALVRLAWLYVLRNDPRSRAVLDLAEARRSAPRLAPESVAMLDQAWGEYWRRAGDVRLAISFKHKALNAFERLGDTRQTLSTWNNLSLLYIEARDYARAVDCGHRVVSAAEAKPVDPYLLTSALGNIGIAHFWQERYDEAIDMYRRGLSHAERAGLRVIANRAHYNLAEAHFKRFQARGDPADEKTGDHHIALVLAAPVTERDGWFQDAAPQLKVEVLGDAGGLPHERLLHEESAVHFEEMKDVQRQRAILGLPGPASSHVQAHLAIADAYLAIAVKEREAALALIRRHALGSAFDATIDGLGKTFSRGLSREKTLLADWVRQTHGVLGEERVTSVLHQVMATGSINKSGYAQLCQVGPATASKHLATLAERGLLVQTGKGPSTRYVLP